MKRRITLKEQTTTMDIAKALFTINKHAKTALEPQHLYFIKKKTIEKLLDEEKAKKIGLHFSNNPKLSNQHSILLIQVENYYFHLPPKKEDFKTLEHLGSLDDHYRNPRTKMSLSRAKKIIYQYIEWNDPPQKRRNDTNKKRVRNKKHSSFYIPSSLGKMEWPPTKKFPSKYN